MSVRVPPIVLKTGVSKLGGLIFESQFLTHGINDFIGKVQVKSSRRSKDQTHLESGAIGLDVGHDRLVSGLQSDLGASDQIDGLNAK